MEKRSDVAGTKGGNLLSPIGRSAIAGFGAALAILLIVSVLSIRIHLSTQEEFSLVEHTIEVLLESERLVSMLKDAETGQRGYLITGEPRYLEPYQRARENQGAIFDALKKLTSGNPEQQVRLVDLEPLLREKDIELRETINLRRDNGFEAAREVVATDRGKQTMDEIRVLIAQIEATELALLANRRIVLQSASNQSFWMIVVGAVVALAMGSIAIVVMYRHTRAREITQRALRKVNVELEASNKELNSFAYSVSHDLRAPLRAIDGFSASLLQDHGEGLNEVGKDMLRRVRRASQRLAALIDAMLILSRATRREMRVESVDLSTLARSVADSLRAEEPERQASILLPSKLEVRGDRELLRVVLENLLGNAWKFTSGKPQSQIEFGVTQVDGERAYFVRDDGAGFDMAYADKLFSPFQRLHREDEFPGDGIGLATVERILHRHGGRVWAEGAVNKGATFFFTF